MPFTADVEDVDLEQPLDPEQIDALLTKAGVARPEPVTPGDGSAWSDRDRQRIPNLVQPMIASEIASAAEQVDPRTISLGSVMMPGFVPGRGSGRDVAIAEKDADEDSSGSNGAG